MTKKQETHYVFLCILCISKACVHWKACICERMLFRCKRPPDVPCYYCIRECLQYCIFLASPCVLVYIGHFVWPLIRGKGHLHGDECARQKRTLRHHSSRMCRCDWPPLGQEIEEERRRRKGVISQAKLPKGHMMEKCAIRVATLCPNSQQKSKRFLRNQVSIFKHVNVCHRDHH